MYLDFTNVLVFFIFGLIFVILNVSVLSRILRPSIPHEEKETTYECGEPAVGTSWIRFDIRFYTVALIFLIFDVEVAFLYPWAGIFKQNLDKVREARELAVPLTGFQESIGSFLFFEMMIFVLILVVGYIYVWAKGDLQWIKTVSGQQNENQNG
jgi:NADH-quinone oxidoreductase subunit A